MMPLRALLNRLIGAGEVYERLLDAETTTAQLTRDVLRLVGEVNDANARAAKFRQALESIALGGCARCSPAADAALCSQA